MKQSTFFILCGALALGSLAVGIIGAIHDERKEKKHKPAATFRDLYDDNAASEPSIFDISPECCYDTSCPDPDWLSNVLFRYLDEGLANGDLE